MGDYSQYHQQYEAKKVGHYLHILFPANGACLTFIRVLGNLIHRL